MVILIQFLFTFGLCWYAWQMTRYVQGWRAVRDAVPPPAPVDLPGISVLVPVRNEEEGIHNCLQAIAGQDYPRELVEFIVIDDYSTDRTASIVRAIPNVQLIRLSDLLGNRFEHHPNKKRGIEIGVRKATHQLIACMDGDSVPEPGWLMSIAQSFADENVRFSTGPVLPLPGKGMLQQMITHDLLGMAMITAGAIGRKQPEMANGSNMAFRRAAFEEVNGYEGLQDLPSGDDVFLMQRIQSRYARAINFRLSPEALVRTSVPQDFRSLVQQRLRWLSKGMAFPHRRTSLQLFGMYLVHLSFLLMCAMAVFHEDCLFFLLFFGGMRWIFDWYMLREFAPHVGGRTPGVDFVLTELAYNLYVVVLGPMAVLGSYRWKERKVKAGRQQNA